MDFFFSFGVGFVLAARRRCVLFSPITERSGWRAVHGTARRAGRPCYAGVSSDRTNLSPFTKDYRGLALPCDLRVFAARKGAILHVYTHTSRKTRRRVSSP